MLENGECIIAINAQSVVTPDVVHDHIKRMETLGRYKDIHHDGRNYFGSVAGALIEGDARDFALKNGLYVIEDPEDAIQTFASERAQAW